MFVRDRAAGFLAVAVAIAVAPACVGTIESTPVVRAAQVDSGRRDVRPSGGGTRAPILADSPDAENGSDDAPAAVAIARDGAAPGAPAAPVADVRSDEPVATEPAGCFPLPSGNVVPCATDPVTGQISRTGYLELRFSGGARPAYVCATDWQPLTGFFFKQNEVFLSDSAGCCGTGAPVVASLPAMLPTPYYLGTPHGPTQIKPQEFVNGKAGAIRHDPFAVTVMDRVAGRDLSAKMVMWQAWAGDGKPHQGPDGDGPYFFPKPLTVNYVIMQEEKGGIVTVVGPEVSVTADYKTLLGHPTMGACVPRGSSPLCLMGGEIHATTLNNNSGRYGLDSSVTREALDNAAKLFNSYDVKITTTDYFPPRKL